MENTKLVGIGQNAIDESALPIFVLITLNKETGIAELVHSKILDTAYICDILSSALDQMELKLSIEEEDKYIEH